MDDGALSPISMELSDSDEETVIFLKPYYESYGELMRLAKDISSKQCYCSNNIHHTSLNYKDVCTCFSTNSYSMPSRMEGTSLHNESADASDLYLDVCSINSQCLDTCRDILILENTNSRNIKNIAKNSDAADNKEFSSNSCYKEPLSENSDISNLNRAKRSYSKNSTYLNKYSHNNIKDGLIMNKTENESLLNNNNKTEAIFDKKDKTATIKIAEEKSNFHKIKFQSCLEKLRVRSNSCDESGNNSDNRRNNRDSNNNSSAKYIKSDKSTLKLIVKEMLSVKTSAAENNGFTSICESISLKNDSKCSCAYSCNNLKDYCSLHKKSGILKYGKCEGNNDTIISDNKCDAIKVDSPKKNSSVKTNKYTVRESTPEKYVYPTLFDHGKRCQKFLWGQDCSGECHNIHRFPWEDGVVCRNEYRRKGCLYKDKCRYLHMNQCEGKIYLMNDPLEKERCWYYLHEMCYSNNCQLIHSFPSSDGILCRQFRRPFCDADYNCVYIHAKPTRVKLKIRYSSYSNYSDYKRTADFESDHHINKFPSISECERTKISPSKIKNTCNDEYSIHLTSKAISSLDNVKYSERLNDNENYIYKNVCSSYKITTHNNNSLSVGDKGVLTKNEKVIDSKHSSSNSFPLKINDQMPHQKASPQSKCSIAEYKSSNTDKSGSSSRNEPLDYFKSIDEDDDNYNAISSSPKYKDNSKFRYCLSGERNNASNSLFTLENRNVSPNTKLLNNNLKLNDKKNASNASECVLLKDKGAVSEIMTKVVKQNKRSDNSKIDVESSTEKKNNAKSVRTTLNRPKVPVLHFKMSSSEIKPKIISNVKEVKTIKNFSRVNDKANSINENNYTIRSKVQNSSLSTKTNNEKCISTRVQVGRSAHTEGWESEKQRKVHCNIESRKANTISTNLNNICTDKDMKKTKKVTQSLEHKEGLSSKSMQQIRKKVKNQENDGALLDKKKKDSKLLLDNCYVRSNNSETLHGTIKFMGSSNITDKSPDSNSNKALTASENNGKYDSKCEDVVDKVQMNNDSNYSSPLSKCLENSLLAEITKFYNSETPNKEEKIKTCRFVLGNLLSPKCKVKILKESTNQKCFIPNSDAPEIDSVYDECNITKGLDNDCKTACVAEDVKCRNVALCNEELSYTVSHHEIKCANVDDDTKVQETKLSESKIKCTTADKFSDSIDYNLEECMYQSITDKAEMSEISLPAVSDVLQKTPTNSVGVTAKSVSKASSRSYPVQLTKKTLKNNDKLKNKQSILCESSTFSDNLKSSDIKCATSLNTKPTRSLKQSKAPTKRKTEDSVSTDKSSGEKRKRFSDEISSPAHKRNENILFGKSKKDINGISNGKAVKYLNRKASKENMCGKYLDNAQKSTLESIKVSECKSSNKPEKLSELIAFNSSISSLENITKISNEKSVKNLNSKESKENMCGKYLDVRKYVLENTKISEGKNINKPKNLNELVKFNSCSNLESKCNTEIISIPSNNYVMTSSYCFMENLKSISSSSKEPKNNSARIKRSVSKNRKNEGYKGISSSDKSSALINIKGDKYKKVDVELNISGKSDKHLRSINRNKAQRSLPFSLTLVDVTNSDISNCNQLNANIKANSTKILDESFSSSSCEKQRKHNENVSKLKHPFTELVNVANITSRSDFDIRKNSQFSEFCDINSDSDKSNDYTELTSQLMNNTMKRKCKAVTNNNNNKRLKSDFIEEISFCSSPEPVDNISKWRKSYSAFCSEEENSSLKDSENINADSNNENYVINFAFKILKNKTLNKGSYVGFNIKRDFINMCIDHDVEDVEEDHTILCLDHNVRKFMAAALTRDYKCVKGPIDLMVELPLRHFLDTLNQMSIELENKK